jgi:hypothetical protein
VCECALINILRKCWNISIDIMQYDKFINRKDFCLLRGFSRAMSRSKVKSKIKKWSSIKYDGYFKLECSCIFKLKNTSNGWSNFNNLFVQTPIDIIVRLLK